METERICPNCRKALPPDVPLGLCPECLIKSGFPTGTEPGEGGMGRFVPPPVEEIARLFPQFEILGFIGKGGMGAVYKARQPALDRFVALKVLPPAVANDPGFAERFNREARALARLSHPNIVVVYDFGKAGALHYLVMEFVDGTNLREVERAVILSSVQALAFVPQICEALQFAHNEGIVHRDIKPENLLIDKKGRVKITDFGIAKILDVAGGKVSLTGAKDVVGTPHYMAPEQIENPQTVDHRADIYSLGVVFYEMLTGELPLGKFAPPSKKVHVDVRLDEVVLHTLEKEPERRYQQVSQVKTDVETITGTTPPVMGAAPMVGAAPPVFPSPPTEPVSDKIILPAFLLAFFFGVFGAHRFYVGKIGTGILQLFTFGGLGIWATIDWILILCKAFTDKRGRRITNWWHPVGSAAKPPKQPPPAKPPVPPKMSGTPSGGSNAMIVAPAVALLAAGCLKLFFALMALLFLQFGWRVMPLNSTFGHIGFPVWGFYASFTTVVFSVIPALVIIYGAVEMMRIRCYGWAIAAAIVAIAFCNIVGLPAGIWALIVLLQPSVREVFVTSQKPSTNETWPWILGVVAVLCLLFVLMMSLLAFLFEGHHAIPLAAPPRVLQLPGGASFQTEPGSGSASVQTMPPATAGRSTPRDEPYFGPVHKVVLNDSGKQSFLNLDKHKVLPAYSGDAAGFDDWKKTNDIDLWVAMSDEGKLGVNGSIVVAEISQDQWSTFNPADIFSGRNTNDFGNFTTNVSLQISHAYVFATRKFEFGVMRIEPANGPYRGVIITYKMARAPVTLGPVMERFVFMNLEANPLRALNLASGESVTPPQGRAASEFFNDTNRLRAAGVDLYGDAYDGVKVMDMRFWSDSSRSEHGATAGAVDPWADVGNCSALLWWLESNPLFELDTNNPDDFVIIAGIAADRVRRLQPHEDALFGTNVCFFTARDGTAGALQVIGYSKFNHSNSNLSDHYDPGHPWAVVHYRLVQGERTGEVTAGATYAVAASGTPPLSYQWYFNGTNPAPGTALADLTNQTIDVGDATDFSKSFDVKPEGKLTVNVDRGDVHITGSDEPTVEIHVQREVSNANDSDAAEILKEEHVVLKQDQNDISITAQSPSSLKHFSIFGSNPNLNVHYEITVPRKFEVHVETSGGDVNVAGVEDGINLKTMGGKVDCQDIGGDVDGYTMGGDIHATRCQGGLQLETMGGNINVEDFSGPAVHATTQGGSVSADFADAPTADCELHTTGGNLSARLPENAAVTFDAQTQGGSITTDFQVQPESHFANDTLKGPINGGGPTLKMETLGGNIEVLKQ